MVWVRLRAAPSAPQRATNANVDGVDGLVVPHEDWPALANKLEVLMDDQTLRFRLGEAARQKLRSLDWSVVEPHWRSVLALPKL